MTKRPLLGFGFLLSLLPLLYVLPVGAGWLAEEYVRFARPQLAVVAPIAMGFVALRMRGEPGKRSRARTWLADAALCVTTLALALASIGVEIGRPLDRLTVIVVVDRSRSIDLVPDGAERAAREATAAQESMRDSDRIAVVAFGASAVTEQPARSKDERSAPQQAVIPRDGSDLDAAIRRALSEVPVDSAARIVLLSDGVATRGDVMTGAAAALAAQVPVDVLVLEQRDVPDIRVVALRGPVRGNAGESIDLRAVIQSPKETDVELRVLLDGQLIRKGQVRIAAGEDVVRVREKLPDAGLHRYDVEISATDPSLDVTGEDNAGSTFVRVRGRASALVLEGDPGKGAFVSNALEQAEFLVDEAGAGGVPGELSGFVAYDVVVLSDIPASILSRGQIDALATYVRDFGGGLVLLGGDRSMGPGGYGKTAIEEVSPLSFDLKQDQRRASLAEVIGIDISGSMGARVGGQTKLELANEAASRAAELLGPGDLIGIEHVDMEVHWTVPLGPVQDKVALDKAIRSKGVGGGGIMVPITLIEAYAALRAQSVNIKHVLLLSDGDDADDVVEGKNLAAGALIEGITTSVVSLGGGKDIGHLEELSRLGGGRFYLIEDATRLPAVFAQETILAARSAIVEEPFSVTLANAGQPGAGIDFGEAPELRGYVVTIPKPRATIHLLGPESDPILASWAVGVGRSAAFTSDLKDRWGVDWTSWPSAARLLAQTAREVVRRGEDERVRLESDASGGQLHVRATVLDDDGRAQSFRRLQVKVAGPGGFTRDLALEPTGAGTYSARLPLDRPGTYMALARDDVSGDPVGTTGAVLLAGEELRPTGSDPALLGRVAEFTGGRVRRSLTGIFDDRTSRRFSYEDWTRALTVLAAIALLLSVAARKLGVPEVVVDRWSRWRDSSAADRKRAAQRPASAPARTMESLLALKKAARAPPGPAVTLPEGLPSRSTRARPAARQPVSAPVTAPPAATPAAAAAPAPAPAGKPQSTAELLAAKKRRR